MTRPLAIYIHWPFCKSKCPYCDFNSHVASTIDQDQWRAAYLTEIDAYAKQLGNRLVTSIFFGGGTPSLMDPDSVAAILDKLGCHWPMADKVEITLEANPTSVEAGRFKTLAEAGINRLSLGVQSLIPEALAFLGREHSVNEAQKAIELAHRHFPRFSFDLIYARPKQSLQDWEGELTRALNMAGEHLSLYQLTIEPGTTFHKDRLVGADDDLAADLYTLTQDIMESQGLPAYEISNHAAPGEESLHNLTYWRGGDYIGIGPGAHGRLYHQAAGASVNNKAAGAGDTSSWMATHNWRDPNKWLETVTKSGTGQQKNQSISTSERCDELVMMGLRLSDGIGVRDFKQNSGVDLITRLSPEGLETLQSASLIGWDGQRLKTTPAGRLCLDAILARLLI